MSWFRKWCARIYDGSAVIGWRIARWPWATAEGGSRFGRLAFIALVVAVSWRVPWLFCTIWLVAAWRAGAPEAPPEEDEAPDEEPVPPPRVAPPEEVRAWIIPKIRALIGDSNGIHLETLLDRLIREGHVSAGTRITAFRRDLEANGIPVRDDVKVARATRVGIHRDDLAAVAGGDGPSLLTPPPPDPDSQGRAL